MQAVGSSTTTSPLIPSTLLSRDSIVLEIPQQLSKMTSSGTVTAMARVLDSGIVIPYACAPEVPPLVLQEALVLKMIFASDKTSKLMNSTLKCTAITMESSDSD